MFSMILEVFKSFAGKSSASIIPRKRRRSSDALRYDGDVSDDSDIDLPASKKHCVIYKEEVHRPRNEELPQTKSLGLTSILNSISSWFLPTETLVEETIVTESELSDPLSVKYLHTQSLGMGQRQKAASENFLDDTTEMRSSKPLSIEGETYYSNGTIRSAKSNHRPLMDSNRELTSSHAELACHLTPRPAINPSFRFSPKVTSTASRNVISDKNHKSTIQERNLPSKPVPRVGFSGGSRGSKSLLGRSRSSHLGRFWRKTIDDARQLDEKERYGQLLNLYTKKETVIPKDYSSFRKIAGSGRLFQRSFVSPSPAVSVTCLDLASTLEKKHGLAVKRDGALEHSSSVEFIEEVLAPSPISRLKDAVRVGSLPDVIDLCDSSATKGGDDDIVITKEVVNEPERKNSLEVTLSKSPYYKYDIVKDIVEKFKSVDLNLAKDVSNVERSVSLQEQLTRLQLEQAHERRRKTFEILSRHFPVKIQELPPAIDEFPPLSDEMECQVNKAFKGGPSTQVLANKFSIQITRKDIQTLAGLNWLNDEVINFYMNMLKERGENDNFPSVYAFNTFFYPKLLSSGYSSVRRWTRKVDIFKYNMLLVPVHLGMHWCLAVIDFKGKTIRYYDSMLGTNNKCLHTLLSYLESEHQDKKNSTFDVTDFSTENIKDIPQQMNGSDCGMFACKFAEYLSRGAPVTFTQDHMPYFRRRMVYEIITQRLL